VLVVFSDTHTWPASPSLWPAKLSAACVGAAALERHHSPLGTCARPRATAANGCSPPMERLRCICTLLGMNCHRSRATAACACVDWTPFFFLRFCHTFADLKLSGTDASLHEELCIAWHGCLFDRPLGHQWNKLLDHEVLDHTDTTTVLHQQQYLALTSTISHSIASTLRSTPCNVVVTLLLRFRCSASSFHRRSDALSCTHAHASRPSATAKL
jgi:hypothetical protein